MSILLADAGFFIAVLNRRDLFHAWAADFFRQTRDRILVPAPVLLEVGNCFGESGFRSQVIAFLQRLGEDSRFEVVPLDSELLQEGMQLYADRPDKEWGLTDCISFVVMRREGIKQAVTTDHHFAQAGFTILMQP